MPTAWPPRARRVGSAGAALLEAVVALGLFSAGVLALASTELDLRVQSRALGLRTQWLSDLQTGTEAWRFDLARLALTDPAVDPATAFVPALAADPARQSLRNEQRVERGHRRLLLRTPSESTRSPAMQLLTAASTTDPRWSAWLTQARPANAGVGNNLIETGLPAQAQTLSDGRRALLVAAQRVWIIHPVTGSVMERCALAWPTEVLSATALRSCQAVGGLLVLGSVRATDTTPVGADEALHPSGQVPALTVTLTLITPGVDAECEQRSAQAGRALAFFCRIDVPPSAPDWSGRLSATLRHGAWGRAAGMQRLCRYSVDADGDGVIANAEHPAHYRGVTTHLWQQNFLVVPGPTECPRDSPANTAQGRYASANTEAHEPPP